MQHMYNNNINNIIIIMTWYIVHIPLNQALHPSVYKIKAKNDLHGGGEPGWGIQLSTYTIIHTHSPAHLPEGEVGWDCISYVLVDFEHTV